MHPVRPVCTQLPFCGHHREELHRTGYRSDQIKAFGICAAGTRDGRPVREGDHHRKLAKGREAAGLRQPFRGRTGRGSHHGFRGRGMEGRIEDRRIEDDLLLPCFC